MMTAILLGILAGLIAYKAVIVGLILAGKITGEPKTATPTPTVETHGFEAQMQDSCDQGEFSFIGYIRPEYLGAQEARVPRRGLVK